MGIYKFGIKMLQADFKQSVFYLVSIIFSVTVMFNSFNIINNSSFTTIGGNEVQVCTTILLALISILMVFTFFANSYFVISKTKEMAFEILSGASLYKLAGLLFFQNLLLETIGCLLGFILGVLTGPLFIILMNTMLGLNSNLFEFSSVSFSGTLLIMGVQVLCVSCAAVMYVSSKEIKELFTGHKKVYEPDVRVIKFPPVIYLFVYLIPISSFFLSSNYLSPSLLIFFNLVFTLYGTQGLIRYYLPNKILQWKKTQYINDKINLIAFSNLHYSLRKLDFLIVALSIFSVSLFCIMGIFNYSTRIKIISICAFVSLLILISFSIIYKGLIEGGSRIYTYRQLSLIGFTIKQINKIIKKEVFTSYCIIIGVPLLPLLIYSIIFSKEAILSSALILTLLGFYLFILFLTAVIFYKSYKKLVLKSI